MKKSAYAAIAGIEKATIRLMDYIHAGVEPTLESCVCFDVMNFEPRASTLKIYLLKVKDAELINRVRGISIQDLKLIRDSRWKEYAQNSSSTAVCMRILQEIAEMNVPENPETPTVEQPDFGIGSPDRPIPDKLMTPEAQRLLQAAAAVGLCAGRVWNKPKILLAYFVERASAYLRIGKGDYQQAIHPQKSVTKTKISWQPFEVYYGVSGLAQTRQDYDIEDGRLPYEHEIVDRLFETIKS